MRKTLNITRTEKRLRSKKSKDEKKHRRQTKPTTGNEQELGTSEITNEGNLVDSSSTFPGGFTLKDLELL